jgi:hypothetical protein
MKKSITCAFGADIIEFAEAQRLGKEREVLVLGKPGREISRLVRPNLA